MRKSSRELFHWLIINLTENYVNICRDFTGWDGKNIFVVKKFKADQKYFSHFIHLEFFLNLSEVTILLSQTVFSLLVANHITKTSEAVPLLGILCLLSFALTLTQKKYKKLCKSH